MSIITEDFEAHVRRNFLSHHCSKRMKARLPIVIHQSWIVGRNLKQHFSTTRSSWVNVNVSTHLSSPFVLSNVLVQWHARWWCYRALELAMFPASLMPSSRRYQRLGTQNRNACWAVNWIRASDQLTSSAPQRTYNLWTRMSLWREIHFPFEYRFRWDE